MNFKNNTQITAVILTFNEEKHLERCLSSVKQVTDSIYVIDSYSTDSTLTIAKNEKVKYFLRKFDSHSQQFNWALNQIEPCEWVIRIDADEYLDSTLVNSIKQNAINCDRSISGFALNRRIKFLRKDITYGGIFPVEVIRMFRYGLGKAESRLMDEHIIVSGKTACLDGELVDENLNSLSWWIEKHNRYSSLEALEIFCNGFINEAEDNMSGASLTRRKLKHIYEKAPIPIRASFLFFYRYFIRIGFLDGFHGFLFHFFQGYWYRLLVDAKYSLLQEEFLLEKLTIQKCAYILDIEESIVQSKTRSAEIFL
ncbi:glycosyltransferase family 2 [SAR86 cluster bacterium SAR86E]|uniref:Glycosyltransferase family 2 n=1 Tax=SAR86 cluster bacterium SAR86E TaxID=1208365 RepID=K6FB72_9GAMM|nr:glycosyltransferase family 2 [SAR86 cluster bacterium SAR86E]